MTGPNTRRRCDHCKGRGAYTVRVGDREVVHDPCPVCKGEGRIAVPVRPPIAK